ncbi:hypothetical protein [Flectobacillus major]|uniref:hypothetical protein n=1 Tax=Flectobacillus major TaxID=103 RepID=UPI00041A0EAF|nr:hypothetical protein [Flectobacillus major]
MKTNLSKCTLRFKLNVLLFILALIYNNSSFSQSPGGVSTNIVAWYRGDLGLSSTGWTDRTSNGYDLTRGTTLTNNNFMNFNPVATFSSTTTHTYSSVNTAKGSWPVGTTANTYYYVAFMGTTAGNDHVAGIGSSGANTGQHSGMATTTGNFGSGGSTSLTGTNNAVYATQTWLTNPKSLVRYGFNGGTGNNYMSVNGNIETTSSITVTPTIANTAPFRVGSSGVSGTGNWTGDIAEVIVFSGKHTQADYDKVESYLALKYGLTKNGNYISSTGASVWTVAGHSGYTNNIAGIGNDDALNQKQSTSSNNGTQLIIGTTGISNTNALNGTSLNNGQYLVWGDNGQPKTFSTPFTGIANINYRVSSVWNVQNTGNVGIVRVLWRAGMSNLKLIQSTDATIDASDIITDMSANTTTINGNTYNYADVTLANGQFFTFAGYVCAPGGVLNSLRVWLKGDDGFTPSVWYDHSGNNNHYIQPALDQQPLITNGVKYNFNPTVDFNNNTRNMYIPNGPFSADAMPGTIFIPTLRQVGSGQQHILSFGGSVYNSGTNEFPALGIENTAGNIYIRNAGTGTPSSASAGFALGQNEFRLLDWSWILGTQNVKIGRDGEDFQTATTSATYGNGFKLASGSIIGKELADYYYGDIPEIIMYEKQLTAQEYSRVRSYLAIKYGVTLLQPQNYVNSSNDIIWNSSINTTFNNNIFGIGHDLTSCLNQKISTSLTALNNPSLNAQLIVSTTNNFTSSNIDASRTALTNGQYLMFGDNGNNSNVLTDVDPSICPALSSGVKRIAKSWRTQNTNGVSNVWMELNLNAYEINSNIFLLIGDAIDGSGNITGNLTRVYASSFSSGKAIFNASLSGIKYFTVLGEQAPYTCTLCESGKTVAKQGEPWNTSAKRSANNTGTYNAGTPVGSGQITAVSSIVYNGTAVESNPTSYPRNDGRFVKISRRDNATGTGNTAVYTTQFSAASKVSFLVRGMELRSNQAVIVSVKGFCGTGIVLPKITYERPDKYARYRTFSISGNTMTGFKRGVWYSRNSGAIVTFEKPVEKVEVTYQVNRFDTRVRTKYIRIGDMTLTCSNPVTPNPDNVHVVQDYADNNITQCEDPTLTFKISNTNCTDRVVNITENTLPAGLEYIPDTYNGPGTPTITATTFSLSNITVPPGDNTVTFSIGVQPIATGTFEVQAKYNATVASGGSGNTILSDDESGQVGLQTTKLNVGPATIVPLPDFTVTQDAIGCGNINYTVTFNNTTGSAVTNVIFDSQLDGTQSLNAGTVSNTFGGVTDPDPYTDVDNLQIVGMTIPTGISTFTFQTTNSTNLIDPENIFTIMRDPAVDACALKNEKQAISPAKTCTSCIGGKQVLKNSEAMYNQGTTTLNTVINKALIGSSPESGALSADITFNYSNGALEYIPNSNPRKYGKWARLSRYDNSSTGKVTYTVNLKDASGAVSATPSFLIAGINKQSETADVVKVRGYCGATEVLPKMKYMYNKTANINTTRRRYTIDSAMATATGIKSNYDLYAEATLAVEFEAKVEKIVIEWSNTKTRVRKRVQRLYIGDMTFVCDNPLEPNADLVNINAMYVEDSLPTCEEATMKLKIINQNCTNKVVNIINALPTGIEYVADSYVGLGTETPATLSGQNFVLNNLSVPSGISYLYMKVKPTLTSTSGIYSTQYNYTIVGGTNTPNPYSSDNESSLDGLQATSLTYTAVATPSKPTITLAVDTCYSSNTNSVLTYTISVKNTSTSTITVAEILQNLEASQTYVSGSFVAAGFSTNGTFTNDTSYVAFDNYQLAANGTGTLTYSVNTNDSYNYDETDTSVSTTGDFMRTSVQATIDLNGECASSSTILSNELIVNTCVGSPNAVVNIKVLLQGALNGTTGTMTKALNTQNLIPLSDPYDLGATTTSTVLTTNEITDWVRVELRTGTSGATIQESIAALVSTDGTLHNPDGSTPLKFQATTGNFYVAIRHRNHLGVMTTSQQMISSTPITIDFTSSTTSTFGSNAQATIGSIKALWAGNATGLTVGGTDNVRYSTGDINAVTGYLTTQTGSAGGVKIGVYTKEDTNLDGVVRYSGATRDILPIINTILAHPGNALQQLGFIVSQAF